MYHTPCTCANFTSWFRLFAIPVNCLKISFCSLENCCLISLEKISSRRKSHRFFPAILDLLLSCKYSLVFSFKDSRYLRFSAKLLAGRPPFLDGDRKSVV